MRLQDFSFTKSRYERPNQHKVCGWSLFGKPCQVGPDAEGRCQAQFECVPYRNGDRWHCTRPANAGGKCENGPTATGQCRRRTPRCVPLDSLRSRRGKAVFWSAVFALALLVFFVAMPLRSSFIDPGDLSTGHMLHDNACEQCHRTDVDQPASWLIASVSDIDVHAGNQKCTQCHELGFDAGMAHSLPPQQLLGLRQKAGGASRGEAFRLFVPAGLDKQNPLACSSCHREHKGREHDLKALTAQQCDACHVSASRDFRKHHAEFDNYPYQQRTSIVFDHVAHIQEYFQREKLLLKAPQNCAACHQPDSMGEHMRLQSFDQACAACHSADVRSEKLDSPVMPVIGLPAIDVASLTASGLQIGQWPQDLEDEELPPFMLYLLASEADLEPLLTRLARGELVLHDLSSADRDILQQVQQLVWAIKQLMADIISGGHEALQQRVKKSAGGPLPESQLAALVAQLPAALAEQAQAAWLPSLEKEIARYRKGVLAKTSLIEARLPSVRADWQRAGGWSLQDFALVYRPTGHADDMLHAWLNLLAGEQRRDALHRELLTVLADSKRPGQCGKCHSIEQSGGASGAVIHWQGADSVSAQREFTRFDHVAHFSLLDQQGCVSCHRLDTRAQQQQKVTANWQPIRKSQCDDCHSDSAAGEACTLCHNYHVGQFRITMPVSELTGARHHTDDR